MWLYVCEYVQNKSDGSSHVEVSVLIPKVISWKKVWRLTKEKATLTREIDKGENCWNFMWLKENTLVRVSREAKTDERSMCVGDCIDYDKDRFSVKGVP